MGAGPGTAGLPPGYPRECEQEVTLRDGRRVLIRPILPSDAPELGEAIKTADPDTLRRRFLGAPPRVTPALLAHLTVVELCAAVRTGGHRHGHWARRGGCPV